MAGETVPPPVVSRPGAVFDAVTFVQSLANPAGPAAACWQRVLAGEVTHFASEDTLAELTDVVSRPKLAKKLAIDPDVARTFLEAVRRGSVVLPDIPRGSPIPATRSTSPW